jgi:hypothetical protein
MMKIIDLEFEHCEKQKEINSNKDLDTIMLETIDEILSVFYESLWVEVFFCLSKDFGINRKEVSTNLTTFSNAFRNLLGEEAKLLEIYSMKKLNKKIKAVQDWSETDSTVPQLEFESLLKMKNAEFNRL